VLLTRGAETMLVSANSVVGLPTQQQGGMSTTILQQAGTILLEVEKRNVKHFQVETPYLAAVVKGTQFRVTVDKGDSRVDVLRGQVEVVDFKTGQYTQVFPDQSARVSGQGGGGLSLSGSGTLSPIQQGSPRRSSVSPLPETQPQPQMRTAAATPAAEGAPNHESIWVPQHDDDAKRASQADQGDWPKRLVAMFKDVVSSDHNAGRGGLSTLDIALPAGVGLLVMFGVTIGRIRRPKKEKFDPFKRLRK
jgi:FecR protein